MAARHWNLFLVLYGHIAYFKDFRWLTCIDKKTLLKI
jgi:hypothetical protein